jgi:hypothetical protein
VKPAVIATRRQQQASRSQQGQSWLQLFSSSCRMMPVAMATRT